ncbi:MAG: choice-of-anchor U domain-containing protein [Desulfobacteraceae bacterium]|nr:choice-of-anchor U domain-containing protein [Desulfobacteraceae bacterium]
MSLRWIRTNAASRCLLWAAAMTIALAGEALAMGVSGQDMEKPAPQFSAQADGWGAKLIPRGRSTYVHILFSAEGGTLVEPSTRDFSDTSHEGVDSKNFKSGLFMLQAACPVPGASVRLGMRSDFFTSGTRWYVFNSAATPEWQDAGVEAHALDPTMRALSLTVVDGGPLDSDGRADGRVTVIGGPRDSFWGYAIGTLFIRFFGIFIVLGILMFGMFASGLVFRRIEARRARPRNAGKTGAPGPKDAPVATAPGPAPELAAVVALALHLKLAARSTANFAPSSAADASAWASAGRQGVMVARDRLYRRNPAPLANGDRHR